MVQPPLNPLERLAQFCAKNQLPWAAQTAERFETYLGLLEHFNRAMNLIGPMDRAQIVDQLLLDSAAAAAVIAPSTAADTSGDAGAGILDVGSGAGLPGIPLKILFPDVPLTMVEPRKKRTTFLKIAVERLGLSEVTIARCRLEDFDPGRYGYVISKAFRAPVTWLELAAGRVAPGGAIVCMTRPGERDPLCQRAESLDLELIESCDDTTRLGAPSLGEARAVYVFGVVSST